MVLNWEERIKLPTPKLGKNNFMEHITEHGYFAQQFPACFSSKKLAENLDVLLQLAPCTKP